MHIHNLTDNFSLMLELSIIILSVIYGVLCSLTARIIFCASFLFMLMLGNIWVILHKLASGLGAMILNSGCTKNFSFDNNLSFHTIKRTQKMKTFKSGWAKHFNGNETYFPLRWIILRKLLFVGELTRVRMLRRVWQLIERKRASLWSPSRFIYSLIKHPHKKHRRTSGHAARW